MNGVAAAAQVLNIASGSIITGDQTVNILNGATPGASTTLSIMNGAASAGTQTINMLASGATRAGVVNIGTGAAAHAVTIGSTNTTAATTIQAGSAGITLTGAVTSSANITSGTTLVSTTSITATLGDITATNGNFVASAAGKGIVVPAAIISAGATPQTSNARCGQVVFSGVSIAAAADQTLVISNSTITGATTVVMVTMSGGQTGSALSIKSITNSAGSCSIVVTNGTGATTNTANLTFSYMVLN